MAEFVEFGVEQIEGGRIIQANRMGSVGLLLLNDYDSSREGSEYAEAVATETGVACLAIDFGSEERPKSRDTATINAHLEKAKKGYDYLASSRNVDPSQIRVVGARYGGYLALLLSKTVDLEKVLLLDPSPTHKRALEAAAELAELNDKKIELVHEKSASWSDIKKYQESAELPYVWQIDGAQAFRNLLVKFATPNYPL